MDNVQIGKVLRANDQSPHPYYSGLVEILVCSPYDIAPTRNQRAFAKEGEKGQWKAMNVRVGEMQSSYNKSNIEPSFNIVASSNRQRIHR